MNSHHHLTVHNDLAMATHGKELLRCVLQHCLWTFK